ncbi:MFS transporter [Streptomyces purpurascens]|uniref:MFS transporter n=1 Tax=Streptomyces purpurascens TaxID=1924 RepID=UPI003C2BF166
MTDPLPGGLDRAAADGQLGRRARAVRAVRAVLAGGSGRLLAATLVQAVGQGAAMACNTVFFVTVVGLAPAQVGVTNSVAAVVSMGAAVVAGRVVDRRGTRNVAVWWGLLAAAAVASYAGVADLTGFVLVHLLVGFLRAGKRVSEYTVVGQLGADSTRLRAYQRTVLNAGMALGTLAAALPLYLDTRAAYLTVIFCNAVALAAGSLLLRSLPVGKPAAGPGPKVRRRAALRDPRYVAVGLLCGLIEVRDSILTMALPLWVAQLHTPRPTISVLLFLNTTLVILCQVRAARGADTVRGAVGTVRRGALALAAGCLLIAAAVLVSGPWSLLVLLCAVTWFTFGEMWTSAGSWTLSYELADPRSLGDYQGVFGMASGVGMVVGPVVATTAALASGGRGWLLVAAGFALLGFSTRAVVGKAARAGGAAEAAALVSKG